MRCDGVHVQSSLLRKREYYHAVCACRLEWYKTSFFFSFRDIVHWQADRYQIRIYENKCWSTDMKGATFFRLSFVYSVGHNPHIQNRCAYINVVSSKLNRCAQQQTLGSTFHLPVLPPVWNHPSCICSLSRGSQDVLFRPWVPWTIVLIS